MEISLPVPPTLLLVERENLQHGKFCSDPTDPALGNGDFTLTATAIIDGQESSPSEGASVNITLDCPPTITAPEKRN